MVVQNPGEVAEKRLKVYLRRREVRSVQVLKWITNPRKAKSLLAAPESIGMFSGT
jgi:hypothetical protein